METTSRRLGRDKGYMAGFLVYWTLWCLAFPIAVVGPRRLSTCLRRVGHSPTRASLALLGAGPAAALVTSAAPARRALDARLLLSGAVVGIVNGTLEEFLWRALYVELFPDDPVCGWAYPAVWFGLWHMAPQRVHASDRPAAFVAAATSLGLAWGAIAQRTGSVRWTIASHVLTDAVDLSSPNVRFLAARGR